MMVAKAVEKDKGTGVRIQVEKAVLLDVVERVGKVVENKTTIPIINNLLFVASVASSGHGHQDGAVEVIGTDLDSRLKLLCQCKVLSPGRFTVPARKLKDTLKKLKILPDTTVTISVDAGHWVTVECGPCKVKLPGMSAINFPNANMRSEKDVVTAIPARVLLGMIQRTRYAIATDESRYTMNGALLEIYPDKLRMVSTDGHRLARVDHNGHYSGVGEMGVKAVLSTGGLDHLVPLLKSCEKGVEVAVRLGVEADQTAHFQCEDWELYSRRLTGQFPNYGAVLPKSEETPVRVWVEVKKLADTLGRVGSFADKRSGVVRLGFDHKGVTVTASITETGEARETVQAEVETPGARADMAVRVNYKYVMDKLKTFADCGVETVKLGMRDAQSSLLFVPQESTVTGKEYQSWHVLMPIRL